MSLRLVAYASVFATMSVAAIRASSDQADRIREAATVFREIMRAPDGAIPGSVLDQSRRGCDIFRRRCRAGLSSADIAARAFSASVTEPPARGRCPLF
jgi:hypothetical protein